ncbi:MAG: TonB-dependent receptor [Balneolaceae bacterium]
MFLKQTVLLLSLFLTFLAAEARGQTVQGVVHDSQTLTPLQGANILQVQTANGTATDEEGRFELTLLAGQSMQIRVSYLGYQSEVIDIENAGTPLAIYLDPQALLSGEVFVNALRVDESTPIAYSNISREEIQEANLGQDIPWLVSSTPSVVATSDAGAGIGYTGIRIRGVDPTRINVTINGIPLNDAESHGVFWVNMPDLASSVENIQIQRGVGSSTHGAGAFGATMNLQTARMERDPYGIVSLSTGSYETQKANVLIGTGRLDNGWQFEGRLSKLESDGYIDRASSDLKSFYLSGARQGEKSLLKWDLFSGQERTYQAWNGVPEPILEDNSPELERYIANLYSSEEAEHLRQNIGNRRFNEFTYENQVDNYQQDHFQLHYSYQVTDRWLLNSSLHFTRGQGYYEQFRPDERLSTYGINPIEIGDQIISRSDVIRRRWLDNYFYGTVLSGEYRRENWNLTLGGGYNEYDGDHFGEVIWARFAGESDYEDQYYQNNGFKTDLNLYGKLNWYFSDTFNTYLDLQYRMVSYRFEGPRIDESGGNQTVIHLQQEEQLNFFNPKFGFVYRLNENNRAFASLSVGGREPARRDYVESTPESRPKPERLFDYEVGYMASYEIFRGGINLYYMNYRDQLILTGAVNDVGAYVRENVEKSYRAGIELHGSLKLLQQLTLDANATFSRNIIPEYTHYLDDFDEGGQDAVTYESTDIAFSPNFISHTGVTWQTGGFTATVSNKIVSRQYLDNTGTESRSIDPYVIQDLRAGYRFDNTPAASSISLLLQVNNILDKSYVSNGYTFGWLAGGQEQHFNYYYPQAGRNILAKIEIEF